MVLYPGKQGGDPGYLARTHAARHVAGCPPRATPRACLPHLLLPHFFPPALSARSNVDSGTRPGRRHEDPPRGQQRRPRRHREGRRGRRGRQRGAVCARRALSSARAPARTHAPGAPAADAAPPHRSRRYVRWKGVPRLRRAARHSHLPARAARCAGGVGVRVGVVAGGGRRRGTPYSAVIFVSKVC